MFERDPYALDERTETARKEGDVLVGCMALDGLERLASAMVVILFFRVRHGRRRFTYATLRVGDMSTSSRKTSFLQALQLSPNVTDEVNFSAYHGVLISFIC